MEQYFTFSLRDLKIHFGLQFYFVVYLMLKERLVACYFIFFESRETVASPSRRLGVEQKLISRQKKKFLNAFLDRGGAVDFVHIFCQLLPSRNFCDKKLLKGNLVNFFLKKVVRVNAEQIVFNFKFPAKSLSFWTKKFC